MVRLPHAQARRLADKVQGELVDGAERIEIAGSLRRGAADVGDVELVAVPRWRPALFGDGQDFDELDEAVERAVALERLAWRDLRTGKRLPANHRPKVPKGGRRFYPLLAVRAGFKVDLFVVRPPATWGAIFAIRTGNASFSKALVVRARMNGVAVEEGRAVELRTQRVLDTPEERDFFDAIGVPFVEPALRDDVAARRVIQGGAR